MYQGWGQVHSGVANSELRTQKLYLDIRHEIFPEFSRPPRSFSWKSQIQFNIYGGGGYHIFCVLVERHQCWNGTP